MTAQEDSQTNDILLCFQQVLHDWNDEKCLEILKKCFEATPANGRVIIRENVLRSTADRSAQSRVAHAANLGMLSYCGEGKERTADEWRELITAAGFSRVTFLNFSGLDLLEVLKT
jgi:caffeic acid 3-O-methyltransferase